MLDSIKHLPIEVFYYKDQKEGIIIKVTQWIARKEYYLVAYNSKTKKMINKVISDVDIQDN